MNGKVYVGKRALSIKWPGDYAAITGVRLWVDDENVYEAGDESGVVLEADCPYASQEIANSVLAGVQGYQYKPVVTTGAEVSPIVELGDGLTVDGEYTQLAYQKIRFSPGEVSDVSAPGRSEVDHEYKVEGAYTQQMRQKLAQTRSLISKSAEEIQLLVESEIEELSASITVSLQEITQRVDGLDGEFTQVSTTLDGLTVTDSTGTTKIKGSSIETETLYVRAANIQGTLQANQINLSGAITWNDLASDAQSKVEDAQDTADTAQSIASSASSTASNVSSRFAQVTQQYGNQTYLDGSMILTDSIYASAIHLGGDLTIYSTQAGNIVGGYMGYTTSNLDGTPGMHMQRGQAEVAVTTNGARMTYGGANNSIYISNGIAGVFANGVEYQFSPTGFYAYNEPALGSQYALWGQIYSTNSVISTSDRNRKTDIQYEFDERYEKLWSLLKPCTGKFTDGTSGRTHMFLISQDVENAIEEAGLTSLDFAAFIKSPIEEQGRITEYKYALRYEEFIPLIIHRLQKLERELEVIKNG